MAAPSVVSIGVSFCGVYSVQSRSLVAHLAGVVGVKREALHPCSELTMEDVEGHGESSGRLGAAGRTEPVSLSSGCGFGPNLRCQGVTERLGAALRPDTACANRPSDTTDAG